MNKAWLLMALVALCGCPEGWRLERVEGERPSVHPEMWKDIHDTVKAIAKEAETDPACARYREPLVHCAASAKWKGYCRRSPDGSYPVAPDKCSRLKSLFSFVHTSDAQLKEHRVHMAGQLSEAEYDGLTNGASRNPALERHDDAVLLATVQAINRLADVGDTLKTGLSTCNAPAPPKLVIHTGDAVDAGMFSELLQYLAVMQQLELPFFNAVGNHDALFFGTFPPEHMKGLNVVVPFVPIVDTDRFMRFHSIYGPAEDPSLPETSLRGDDHGATVKGCAFGDALRCAQQPCQDAPCSRYHGFDLACYPGRPKVGPLCPEARGYYSFDVTLPPAGARKRTARLIVLNTAELLPATVGEAFRLLSKGHMLPEQLRWLEDELERPAGDAELYHLVFGHHTLGSFVDDEQAERLTQLLASRPSVLGYFSGHTHKNAFVAHPRPGGGTLWESVAGSTLVYPQLARLVELLEEPPEDGGRLLVRVMSFRQQLSDGAAAIARSSPHCEQLARRARMGRDGARADRDRDNVAEHLAVPHANALFVVRHQGTAP